jgi:hypothetical protein
MRIRLVPAAVATLLAALLAGCGDDQSGTQADFTRPGDVPVSVLLSPDGEDWREVDSPPEQFANVVLLGVEGGRGGFIAAGEASDGLERRSLQLRPTRPSLDFCKRRFVDGERRALEK